MTILLRRVLDNRVVDACLGPALWLGGLIVAFVLLPPLLGVERVPLSRPLLMAVVFPVKIVREAT